MFKYMYRAAMLAASLLLIPAGVQAAPYAAMVIDARDGTVLHSRNADTRLHPASLTKMMTLYLAFEAVESGVLDLDQQIRISRNAASEPPSRLGLRAGQRLSVRYLIRAAAIRSANDAATALGEAIAGSEAAFATRMTETARSLGMTQTTFRNAHGLTANGHMSTARDMAELSRHLFYDFPEYYNIFGRTSTYAGLATVRNTNRRLLNSYRGADGIKTGYTRAAGYNLAASAERGQERIIAVIFGGRSSDWRYRRMVELLDMGFARAPSNRAVVRPSRVDTGAVLTSMVPVPRGTSEVTQLMAAADFVGSAFVSSASAATLPATTERLNASVPLVPASRRRDLSVSEAPLDSMMPRARPGGAWAVQLGAYRSADHAEAVLTTALVSRIDPLTGAQANVAPTIVEGVNLHAALFTGLSETQANGACSALQSRGEICRLVPPSS